MRRSLVCKESSTIEIIELEPYTNLLSSINGKFCSQVIFPIGSISSSIVSQTGNRREGVGEVVIIRSYDKIIVGLCENKLFIVS